jgi:glycosyltransferase involved in cell wall biosynthesis
MKAGLVSIVIPCYKGERFLKDAIESCLRQTYQDVEVLVVDDASPDRSADIAEQYVHQDPRVRLIRRERNGGVSRAFNSGFQAATGEYFTRLAQDDFFQEAGIEKMVQTLKAHPDAGIVYCDVQYINEHKVLTAYAAAPEPAEALNWCNNIGTCVMWTATVWEAVGEFNPEFDFSEDYDYWLRVKRRYPIFKCQQGALLFIRVHATNATSRYWDRQKATTLQLLDNNFSSPMTFQEWIWRRKAMSHTHYSFVPDSFTSGHRLEAVKGILHSFLYWPFSYGQNSRITFIGRVKTFVVILLRFVIKNYGKT